jgi:hypothetical protein
VDAQLRETARSVQRAVLEVLLDRMAWDAHSALSASDVLEELRANADHYDGFFGGRATDTKASALDRRGVADVLEALAAKPAHRDPVLIKEREGRCNIFFVDADVLVLVRCGAEAASAAHPGGGGSVGQPMAEADGADSQQYSTLSMPSLRGPHADAMEQAKSQVQTEEEDYLLALKLQFGEDEPEPRRVPDPHRIDITGAGSPDHHSAARGGGSRSRNLGGSFATAVTQQPSAPPLAVNLAGATVIDLTLDLEPEPGPAGKKRRLGEES